MKKFLMTIVGLFAAGGAMAVIPVTPPVVVTPDSSSTDATGALVLLGLIALVLVTKSATTPSQPATDMVQPDVTPDT
jgi:hypothetical protein